MDEVIARKSKKAGVWISAVTLVIGGILVFELVRYDVIGMLAFMIVSVFAIIADVLYMKTPNEIVTVYDGHSVLLPKNELVFPGDILEVKVRRTLDSVPALNFGTVTVRTASKTYRLFFVDDFRETAEVLRDMAEKETPARTEKED